MNDSITSTQSVNQGQVVASIDINVANDITKLVNATQQKIWMNNSYCKYTDMETEKLQIEIKYMEAIIEKSKKYIKHEKDMQEFLAHENRRALKTLDVIQDLCKELDKIAFSMSLLLDFQKEHNDTKIKKYEKNYQDIRDNYENAHPQYKEFVKKRLEHKKLIVEKNIITHERNRILDIIKQRNNIWNKMYYNSIINFVKSVMDYQEGKKLHSEIKLFEKRQIELSNAYQEKCLEKEKQKINNTNQELIWSQLPDIQEVCLLPKTVIIQSNYNPKYNVSTTLEKLQQMKAKCEQKRKKFEESKKQELSNLKRTISQSKFNRSLNKSFEKMLKSEVHKNILNKKRCIRSKKQEISENTPSGLNISKNININLEDKNQIKKTFYSKTLNSNNYFQGQSNLPKNIKILDQKTIVHPLIPKVNLHPNFPNESDLNISNKSMLTQKIVNIKRPNNYQNATAQEANTKDGKEKKDTFSSFTSKPISAMNVFSNVPQFGRNPPPEILPKSEGVETFKKPKLVASHSVHFDDQINEELYFPNPDESSLDAVLLSPNVMQQNEESDIMRHLEDPTFTINFLQPNQSPQEQSTNLFTFR